MLSGHDAIYRFQAPGRSTSEAVVSGIITAGHFTIPATGAARQVVVEVYFDPQLYDMEVLLEATEASDVRAHRYSGKTDTDVSQFKGARRVFVEAEPGEYTLQLIAKLPALSASTAEFAPRYLEC